MYKPFLKFDEFWKVTGEKRSHSVALNDTNMMVFDTIKYDANSDTYLVNVRLKDEYKEKYFTNKVLIANGLVFLDTIHLIHWADWLNIGILNKLYPVTKEYFFFSTKTDFNFTEPTFVDQPMMFKMSILLEKRRNRKSEYTFMNTIGTWGYILSELVVVKEQFPILEYYHKKHEVF